SSAFPPCSRRLKRRRRLGLRRSCGSMYVCCPPCPGTNPARSAPPRKYGSMRNNREGTTTTMQTSWMTNVDRCLEWIENQMLTFHNGYNGIYERIRIDEKTRVNWVRPDCNT